LSIYTTGTPLHAPKVSELGPEMAENSWRDFAHPYIFALGDTASHTALYNRQQANFGTC